jgi:hypothetical protein
MTKCEFEPFVLDMAYHEPIIIEKDVGFSQELVDQFGIIVVVGTFEIQFNPIKPTFKYYKPWAQLAYDINGEFVKGYERDVIEVKTPLISIPMDFGLEAYINYNYGVYIFNPFWIIDGMMNVIEMKEQTFDYLKIKVLDVLNNLDTLHQR